jgi:hypothetical protein
MGTNFYWVVKEDARLFQIRGKAIAEPDGDLAFALSLYDEVKRSLGPDSGAGGHIGKRSAAGMYCWDCKQSLCKGGDVNVHMDRGFYTNCPRCGLEPTQTFNPALVELGFARPIEARPTGVTGASSFTWAQDPGEVRKLAEDGAEVIDEYGRVMTGQAFLMMVYCNCPLEFQAIGEDFS